MAKQKNKQIEKVYRFLALRPRSQKEFSAYLNKRKFSPKLSQEIFKIVREQGLIDDKQFARWWVEQRTSFKPKGKKALKAELKNKGIEEKIIEEVLKEVDELALAKKAIQKKIKVWRNLSPLDFCQKITTFLAYRGFSWAVIKKIISSCEKFLK